MNYVYSGTSELSVINRRTYFCEFDVTDSEKDEGITVEVKDATAEDLKIRGIPLSDSELEEFDLDELTEMVFSSDASTINELN